MLITNWKAMQVYGCRHPDFDIPFSIRPKHMAGGCWKANLHKDGTKFQKSSGGSPKPKKKVRFHYTRLPTSVSFDKKGYVIL